MDDRALAQLLLRAESHLAHGSYAAAVEALRQALTYDPEHADAHALLALALHGARRIGAAELEAGRAIASDPESALAHLAAATVRYSARDWSAAKGHAMQAAALSPDDPTTLSHVADLLRAMGDTQGAAPFLAQALELAPDDASVRVIAGWAARAAGDVVGATRHAKAALLSEPGHTRALVLRGRLHLDAGQDAEAREHALWALRERPNEVEALALLVGVKMRQSWVMGLWWRVNSALISGGRRTAVTWLVGLFLYKRAIELMLGDLGLVTAEGIVTTAWILFCVYTWVGPAMFRRALERELAGVVLDERF